MRSRLVPTLLTVLVALAGAATMTGAFAVEATQYLPGAGTATRTDVRAELRGAHTATGVVHLGEATVFVDTPSTLTRVQAQAAGAVEGATHVVHIGDATQFVDAPGVRTRSDVRAETLATLRSSRVAR